MLEPSSPPSWLRPASLRWVDASQAYHGLGARRAAGGPGTARSPEWSQTTSDVIHSRRTLEALRQAGCTAITIHFDHGFGLAAQADEFRHAAQLASVCHDLGFRVFAYVEAGALCYESLLAEYPGLAGWVQRSPQGEPVPAQTEVPAWRPCYLSRGFLEYLKRSISLASERMGADGIQLANVGPHDCHCERCQHTFRRFLAARHHDPQATFGLPSFDHVRIPVTLAAADPMLTEHEHFRVHALRSALAEVRIHLRSLSAHLALWAEPRLGAPRYVPFAAFWHLSAPADILTCEVQAQPQGAAGAPLVSIGPYAHALLAGAATRTAVCVRPPADPAAGPAWRSAARVSAEACAAMALGGHVMTDHSALQPAPGHPMTPGFLADSEAYSEWQRHLDFAARHEHYHHRAQSLAEVALTFSTTDLCSEPDAAGLVGRVEEVLLRACLPFDILPARDADSTHHRVFVLAGHGPIADEETETLCAMAREGRGLVLVGGAGSHDSLGRRRQRNALASVVGLPHVRQVRARPGVQQPGATFQPDLALTVRELLPEPPAVEVIGNEDAGLHVAIRALRLPTEQATFHLLNVAPVPAAGVRLRVRADLAPGRHVAWHEPDAPDAVLDSVVDGPTITTALPPFRAYGLVVTS